MSEPTTLTATVEHEDPSGIARVVYECNVFESLDYTIATRWTERMDLRKTRRHKWTTGNRIPTEPNRVPGWVRQQAAEVLAGRVGRVVRWP